jgi:hypothetical protein
MITVISHIFNEEYLLPFWLEHHRTIFDHGIIIDYCSTDKSIEIINKFCPTWEVIKTKNINKDGTPNFKADYVDAEVNEIEERVTGYKVCLNTTEFMFLTKSKSEVMQTLSNNLYYHIGIHNVMGNKHDFFPKNTVEFLKGIDFIGFASRTIDRGHRILHSKPKLNYVVGRHMHNTRDTNNNNYNHDLFFILWTKFYPCNKNMFQRKLQIQNNIPQSDKILGWGHQHITDLPKLYKTYNTELTTIVSSIHSYIEYVKKGIENACQIIKQNNIYYSELVVDSNWGKDMVILENDLNLLQKTDFDITGYKILDIQNYNSLLQRFIQNEILHITNKKIVLENYHNAITEEEHKQILNSMPYKKDMYPDVKEFSEYLEKMVSDVLGEPVKIFNDDLWFRICRPSKINDNDYNPCHRDVYLDFYRNIVNIYLPVVGSNEKSSLTIQPGSHKWSESETMVTQGGAFFKTQNKKYSVDAIVASKQPIEMIRPNPTESQLMLFSPYLIHGCAQNNNEATTRISLEVRFIRNDENGDKQEAEFNEFLKKRNWR